MSRHKRERKVQKQLQEERRQSRIRQEAARREKNEFLKKSIWERLKYFYTMLPTKKAKRVFWLWSPLILTVLLPVRWLIAVTKIDIAWKWTTQILYSFMNGK